jgi:hypothetical protein
MTKAALNFLTLFCVFVCASCVTVKLGKDADGVRAVGIKVKEPASPFMKDPQEEVDASWKNPKNGNVISYLSDCSDKTDPPLDHIVQGTLSGLNDLHFDSTESPMVQSREARRVVASGKVDGVPSQIELLVFKRNMCIYILSYVGVKKTFAENRREFQAFLDGFVAP